MDPLEAFAGNLRRLRHERGLTQEKLADRAGLNLSEIARIETVRRDPGVRVSAKLARGLDVPLSALFEGIRPTGRRD